MRCGVSLCWSSKVRFEHLVTGDSLMFVFFFRSHSHSYYVGTNLLSVSVRLELFDFHFLYAVLICAALSDLSRNRILVNEIKRDTPVVLNS